jgi:hypothetical protein
MTQTLSKPCTAFDGTQKLSSGPLIEVALAVKSALERNPQASILVFDDANGRVVDLDFRGSKSEIIARLTQSSAANAKQTAARPKTAPTQAQSASAEPRGRGRPKLGVVAREVTLLPTHWEWLAAQPGGASVALRKLVHDARRSGGSKQQTRQAHEADYRFMSAIAGDLPGFEEALRALFADDAEQFARHTGAWPDGLRAYATRLAFDRPTVAPAA